MGCRSSSFKLLCCMSLFHNLIIRLGLVLMAGAPAETLGSLQQDARYLASQFSR